MDTPFNRARRAAAQYNSDVLASKHNEAMALLSDLAAVEVPRAPVSVYEDDMGRGQMLVTDPESWKKYQVACTDLIDKLRPLVERAKKFRGTDKV